MDVWIHKIPSSMLSNNKKLVCQRYSVGMNGFDRIWLQCSHSMKNKLQNLSSMPGVYHTGFQCGIGGTDLSIATA